ncbi:reverse transcriptase [Lasius niger]|uniref:Reverse transcriptase n=1 Tax=Lasius niger TaxID=67767 RepID=A0A0J7JX51_LASNI|nr:reverse transcriptase [Lasius niger]
MGSLPPMAGLLAVMLIVGGDFNAKSVLWGARNTDGRGRLLASWAAERDLRVANVGNRPTCVRPQETSVVDITWVSPDLLPFIGDWRVEEGIESLSDHLYISFSLGTTQTCPSARRLPDRKWNRKKFDSDFFRAVLIWKGQEPDVEDRMDVEQMAS